MHWQTSTGTQRETRRKCSNRIVIYLLEAISKGLITMTILYKPMHNSGAWFVIISCLKALFCQITPPPPPHTHTVWHTDQTPNRCYFEPSDSKDNPKNLAGEYAMRKASNCQQKKDRKLVSCQKMWRPQNPQNQRSKHVYITPLWESVWHDFFALGPVTTQQNTPTTSDVTVWCHKLVWKPLTVPTYHNMRILQAICHIL